ncbi:hypothetical protein QCA50_008120 [Cerrena zonata]|uniref:Uncharacterized protein n=1 Tax=Cerrena zonata TaxID=2478898 RepID=A0AAW0G829_9APHY
MWKLDILLVTKSPPGYCVTFAVHHYLRFAFEPRAVTPTMLSSYNHGYICNDIPQFYALIGNPSGCPQYGRGFTSTSLDPEQGNHMLSFTYGSPNELVAAPRQPPDLL